MDEQLTTAEREFCNFVVAIRTGGENISYDLLKLKFTGRITEARMDELNIKMNTQTISW